MWPAVLMSVAAAHIDVMRGYGWNPVPRASSMSPRILNRYKGDGPGGAHRPLEAVIGVITKFGSDDS
ncbi:hypothetical protein MES4922_260022 [Mesorhizobium ventifaucium]|uniref:Uncharacterized protein n=1 Tax=Mesorhizobium ventifaucium TaxID=666020 RepID=A0ABM9DVD5_9HYPH|nr:hypothetical protein MES4922_260022 [Mesorhizobium ventifaucium]